MALHDVTSDTLIVQANLVGFQPLSWLLGLGQQNQHTQWVNMLNFDNFFPHHARKCVKEVQNSNKVTEQSPYHLFVWKGTFRMPFFDEWYAFHIPSLEHRISFDCCQKWTIFRCE